MGNVLSIIDNTLTLVNHAIDFGKFIYNKFQEKEQKKQINDALERKKRQLNMQKRSLEKENKRNVERIAEMEQLLKYQIEQVERERIEREKEWLRKKQEEEQERIRKIQEESEAIDKCKKALELEFIECIFEVVNNFSQEEEKWIFNLIGTEVDIKISNLKEKLGTLFDKLFESENIMQKINDEFIKTLKKTFNPQELKKLNYIVIGSSGVGKSTLINEIFGEKLAKEGSGKRATTQNQKYESKLVPFISLLDTVGTEIGNGHKLLDVLQETLEAIMKQLDSNDPNDHIHCIIYCVTSNRFFEDELELLIKIRNKYEGKKLPIVIVYTRAKDEKEVESVKNTINEFLQKYDENLSDDIFGLTFVKVNAREEEFNQFGAILYHYCYGLSDLMKICYKKGETSYKYAIKNSLIQLGQKAIKEYLDNICNELLKNINYFEYLHQQFEPNFSEYISFCFEKITDINDKKGITKEQLDKLETYLYQSNMTIKEDLSIIKCLICKQIPTIPYKCKCCSAEVCKKCYKKGKYKCTLCNNEDFEEKEKILSNKNKNVIEDINQINEDNNEEKDLYENKINETTIDKETCSQINIKSDNCMICGNTPQNPLICEKCGNQICEECQLNQIQNNAFYQCNNCGNEEFSTITESDCNKNEIKCTNDEGISDKCMICKKIVEDPLKCESCGNKICEICYLQKIEIADIYHCGKCGCADFGKGDDEDKNEIKEFKNEIICINNINENNEKETLRNNKNSETMEENYSMILNNNLNPESKNEIKNYIKEFKNSLLEVLNEEFDKFARSSADSIYTKILEKYIELSKDSNVKIENMKIIEEIKPQALEKINKALKEKAIDNFLSNISSQFYKDIILQFKEKCELKLNDFINNLLNNKQANEFFKDCDALNENKKLIFEEDFNKYIQNLKQKEFESQDKAFRALEQYRGNKSDNNGASSSEQNCNSSENNNSSSENNNSS